MKKIKEWLVREIGVKQGYTAKKDVLEVFEAATDLHGKRTPELTKLFAELDKEIDKHN